MPFHPPISRLVVVMPAFNEAEGIVGFVDEIRSALSPLTNDLSFVVADDRSTDNTASVFDGVDDVTVHTQPANRGHGPTALAAYRAGLALDPAVIVHVDGDGQFVGDEICAAVRTLKTTGADAVHGVRQGRTDPWFRKVLTGAVRLMVAVAVGRGIPDVNTPLRVYRPAVARMLVDAVPAEALVPHVHFSLAEVRAGVTVRYLSVRSIPRRGSSSTGTMWGAVPKVALPPRRLRSFVRASLGEVWRESLRRGAPLRSIRMPLPDASPTTEQTSKSSADETRRDL